MARISVLGLGAMGRRMAARLLAAGHAVTVWNRSPGPAADLQAQGARMADSPRAAVADAEFVLVIVYDDVASRQVWCDPEHGALAALPSGAIAIESSTLSPGWVQQLDGLLAARGVALLDAPVAGSRPQAEAGELIFLVGGDTAVAAACEPMLRQLGSAVHVVGCSGSGAWMKLAVNALLATQALAMAEQLAFLRGAGLDPHRALATLRALPVASPSAATAAALMLADNVTPQAPVALIAKDLGYALHGAGQLGLDLVLTTAVAQRFAAALQCGYGELNFVAVARLYR